MTHIKDPNQCYPCYTFPGAGGAHVIMQPHSWAQQGSNEVGLRDDVEDSQESKHLY